jgi:N-acetylmuramoyl-L-alanine amidase
MLPFFWYMLKVMICSGILFGYYWLLLRNKIFHRYNRFYLLGAISLSLLLPLLKISFWQPADQQSQAIKVLQAVSVGDEYMNSILLTTKKSNWSLEQLYPMAYILVSLIFFLLMLRTLFMIRRLLKKYKVQQVEQVSFVNTEDASTPFSFLKYMFWNSGIDIDTTTGRQIFKHEVAHIQEKHTHDKLFVNIILIFCWCNPFFWLYRKELNMIHEFIADKKAVEDSDTTAFAAMILQAAYPKHRFELTNNFFYSPIKRRLMMLTKNKNPRVNYIGRIMVLPLAVLIFAAFTFKTKSDPHIYSGKKITVVIDAGHGGQDAGAQSADGIFEKDLTLAIAKKVKELNTNDAIEVVLVRDGDVYMNPQQKVTFAKSKNADLVISFHIDNGPKEQANTQTGMSVCVAKNEFANAAESKVLASAIVNEFSNNYGLIVKPQLTQRKPGAWILQANTCPAVLIETGFLNNKKDLAYLKTSAAKETIAKNLLAAIEKYLVNKPAVKNLSEESFSSKQQMEEIAGKIVSKIDTNPSPRIKSLTIHDANDGKVLIEVGSRKSNLLFVLDGVIQGDDFNLNKVKPDDIASIDVIKNETAVASYRTKTLPVTGINPNTQKIENEILQLKLKEVDLANEKQNLVLEQKIKNLALTKSRDSSGAVVLAGVQLNNLEKHKIEIAEYNKAKLAYSNKLEELTVQGYPLDKSKLQEKQMVELKLNAERLNQAKLNYAESMKSKLIVEKVTLQEKELQAKNNLLFTQVEVNPQFTGGQQAWLKFLQANIKSNIPVDNGAKAGKYTVVLKFIVNADGTLSNITCENDPGFGTCTEALRFIKSTPKWQPAVQNGKKVNAYMKQPITFVVEE